MPNFCWNFRKMMDPSSSKHPELDFSAIENKIMSRKSKLLVQLHTILDGLAEKVGDNIEYEEFCKEYQMRTNSSFMRNYRRIAKYLKNWELARVFQDVHDTDRRYVLCENPENGEKYIVICHEKREETVRTVPNRKEDMVAPNTWREKFYEKEVFSRPCWPRANDNVRKEQQAVYRRFLDEVCTSEDAINLAMEWWEPHIAKLPQLLWLLSRLHKSLEKSRGYFLLTQLDQRLIDVSPSIWTENVREPTLCYEAFGVVKSQLVEMNMIIRYDVNNPNMFHVNPIIAGLEFDIIEDRPISMIYDFVKSFRSVKADMIDQMLYDNLKEHEWYSEKRRSLNAIWDILEGNKQLFVICRDDSIQTNRRRDVLTVPMYFSPIC